MARKQGGLGKDFYSILEDNDILNNNNSGGVNKIRISDIEPRRDQPRKKFDESALAALADSISEHGVLQPILLRESEFLSGSYEIIAGERRWRASKMAGLDEIPAIVVDGDALKTAEIALIENLQREDLNPVEEAFAYKSLIDEFGLTHDQVSKQAGKNRSTVTNMLRILDLPDEVLELLKTGDLTTGHAKALLSIDDIDALINLANRIVNNGISVRETEKICKRMTEQGSDDDIEDKQSLSQEKIYIKDLETRAMNSLGRRVKIVNTSRKKVLELTYENNDDLADILKSICGEDIFD